MLPVSLFDLNTPASADTPAGSRRDVVLVVEDEDALAVLIACVLRPKGWRVLFARGGAEALQLIATRGAEIAVALVDGGLPDMSGAELCAEIRTAIPGMPLLLMSGRDQTTAVTALAATGPAAFLPKPYAPAQIERSVNGLLALAA